MSAVTSILENTWRGLVQRRLWPVAVLLVAALVAVPVVLAAEQEPAPAPAGAEAVAARSAELASQPIVASASASEREGLRRVLGARKDPFRPTRQPKKKRPPQRQTDSSESGSNQQKAGAARTGTAAGGGSGGGRSTGAIGGAPSTGADSGTVPTRPRYDTYSLTVRWGPSESEELPKSNVKRLRALPSSEEPVVIYLGLLEDGKTAVFLVDGKATAEGDGKCEPDPANCQTVELKEGETEFFDVADETGAVEQYQLDLVEIHRKRTADAASARQANAARTKGARRALRALAGDDDGRRWDASYRYDAETGLLERVDEDPVYRYDYRRGLLELVDEPR